MSNKELYRETFSKVHTLSNTDVEVIRMKNKRNLRMGKRLIVLVAIITVLFAMTCIANAATDGTLFKDFKVWINGDRIDSQDLLNEDGNIEINLKEGDETKVTNDNSETKVKEYSGNSKVEIDQDGNLTMDVQSVD